MKKINFIFPALLLAACTPQENYKDVRNEVVTIHDKVMTDGELLTQNRRKLDSLSAGFKLPENPGLQKAALEEKKQIDAVLTVLRKDEKLMDEWMQAFQADVEGKSNKEAVEYFKKEKQKILVIDSVYKLHTEWALKALKKTKD